MKRFSFRVCCALVMTASLSSSVAAQETTEVPALAVGDQAVGFELTTFDDEKITLDKYLGADGKTIVLTFVRAQW